MKNIEQIIQKTKSKKLQVNNEHDKIFRLNKLKVKGEDNMGLAVVRMLERENKMYFNNGRKEGKQKIKEIVKKMLAENFSKETIMKITGLNQEEINKIK